MSKSAFLLYVQELLKKCFITVSYTHLSTLKEEAKEAETVWLASDEDREGEAIAWHLYEVLKLKPENTKRDVYKRQQLTRGKYSENMIGTPSHPVQVRQVRDVYKRQVRME